VEQKTVKNQIKEAIQIPNTIIYEPHAIDEEYFSLIISGDCSMKHVLQQIVSSRFGGEINSSLIICGAQKKYKQQIKMLEGLKCNGCVGSITKALKSFSDSIHVDIPTKIVSVFTNERVQATTVQDIITTINSISGKKAELYEPQLEYNTIKLQVHGMKCGSCVGKVTEHLLKNENVKHVDVDLKNKCVTIQCTSLDIESELCSIINRLGFTATFSGVDEKVPFSSPLSPPVVVTDAEDETISMQESHETLLLQNNETDVLVDVPQEMRHLTVNIKKMSCASCVQKIEKAVVNETGVQTCVVNLIMERGEITYDSSLIDETKILECIESLGFETLLVSSRDVNSHESEADDRTFVLQSVSDFLNKEQELTALLKKKQGVVEFDIDNFDIKIQYDDKKTFPKQILRAVKQVMGDSEVTIAVNHAALDEVTKQQKAMRETILRTEEISYWRRLLIVATAFTVPLMIVSMIFGHIPATQEYLMYDFDIGLQVGPLLYWLLATPVQFYCALPFYKLSFQALRHFSSDMNVLIAIATTEAYAYSVFTLVYNVVMTIRMGPATSHLGYGGDNYFETSAALIMFLLLGRWLENIAKGKTSSALVKLMDLQPNTATAVEFEEDEAKWENKLYETEVDISTVRLGDIIKVIPGGRVPVDGIIVKGSTSIDESMITGESVPVAKNVESAVIGGTVNIDGLVYIRTTRTSERSVLTSIAKLVEDAQSQKPRLQAIADRISSYFVPFVIALSIITLLVWLLLGYTGMYPSEWRPEGMNAFVFALLFSASTVIIACPCSLGLATPTAVMVGTGVGALHGVLIKGGKSLESVSKATVVLFDKTGTLTKGELSVDAEKYTGRVENRSNLLKRVAAVESGSDHPIAKAVLRYCKNEIGDTNANVTDFINVSGRGVQCVVDNEIIHIGNEQFMREKGVSGLEKLTIDNDNRFSHCTLVYAARNHHVELVLGLSDTVKEESADVVQKLAKFYPRGKKHGPIRAFMLTGDNRNSANYIAEQVGIPPEQVFASLTPSGKCDKVQELQRLGETVMMIGDGINDSPSLAQADVGVSVASGTDVAIECADVVLMTNNLHGLVTAIDLSGVIYRRIVFNFVWAFVYNVAAIPIAAGVFFPLIKIMIPPWVAGLAMALSSVSVVVSSLALRAYRKPA
jgi:Cu+-exporting ATPase